MRKSILILMMTAVLLSSCACVKQPEPVPEQSEALTEAAEPVPAETQKTETGIESVNKYGNIILTVKPEELKALGFEPADIILVEVGGASLAMPIGTEYSDVDSGEPVCRFKTDDEDGDQVVLAINAGNMAQTLGIAEVERIEDDPGYVVKWTDGIDESVQISLSMVQEQGYAEEYNMHQLAASRTDEREDYAALTDAEYANFRAVSTSGMGAGALYRSSTPVDPDLNRNKEADAQIAACGIRTIVNMTNSEEVMQGFEGYDDTAYAKCDIIALNMEMDFFADAFKEKLANGFRFMAEREGPYLIHCKEGKDRTGFAAGILESLMGATADEIVKDYMLTYYNLYGLDPADERYDAIAQSNIKATLAKAFGLDSIDGEGVDLSQCANDYLAGIGMTADEISALKVNLAKDYA